MKYSSILTIAAFLVVSAGSAFAQDQDDEDITATATIAAPLSVTSGDNLDFGSILQDQNVTLDPHSDGTNTNTGAAATVGEFFVSGSEGSDVEITLNSNTITLSLDDNEFDFNPWLVGNNEDNNEAGNTTEIVKDGSAETTVVTLGAESGGNNNNYWIWVGGEIDATETNNLSEGTYTGTITLTAEYQ